jgi:beta-N-acetylhexosaminidase
MTDDLNMQALAGSLADRTPRTMAAGVDVALHCKGDLAEMQAVAGGRAEMGRRRRRGPRAARPGGPWPIDMAPPRPLAGLAHG